MQEFYEHYIHKIPMNASREYHFSCPETPPTPAPKKGLTGGAIAGIVIGCLVGVLLIGFLAWNMCKPGGDQSSPYKTM